MKTYYYEEAGQQAGPVAGDLLRAQGVQGTTLVWNEEMSDWAPAASVAELAAFFQPVPLPLPPPLPLFQQTVAPTTAPLTAPPVLSPAVMPLVTEPVLTPSLPPRPEFSAEASKHKWWHYVIRAIAVLFILLLARACGTIIRHAITTTTPTSPNQMRVATISARPAGMGILNPS